MIVHHLSSPFAFARYEEGENLSDFATLVAAGRELGLPGIEEYLASEDGVEEVRRDDATGKQR